MKRGLIFNRKKKKTGGSIRALFLVGVFWGAVLGGSVCFWLTGRHFNSVVITLSWRLFPMRQKKGKFTERVKRVARPGRPHKRGGDSSLSGVQPGPPPLLTSRGGRDNPSCLRACCPLPRWGGGLGPAGSSGIEILRTSNARGPASAGLGWAGGGWEPRGGDAEIRCAGCVKWNRKLGQGHQTRRSAGASSLPEKPRLRRAEARG